MMTSESTTRTRGVRLSAFNRLLQHAEDLGVRVEWVRISGPYAGAYDVAGRTIYLDWDLDSRPRHAVSTLAHELAHDHYGDASYGDPRVESRADRKAAEWLICPGLYRDAERAYGSDVHVIALELGVTAKLVRVYRGALDQAASTAVSRCTAVAVLDCF